jgi:uncharacterized protein (TIGR02594 family)
VTPFEQAQRFVGEIRELPGEEQHPFIQWCHMLCGGDPNTPDEVPWCSSFANAIAWMLRLPRSKSKMARSWLAIGEVVPDLESAVVGYDVIILTRGIAPAGHVGFFAGMTAASVSVLGGNQSNGVSIQMFPADQVLGIRRLKAVA